jgi:predicted adenylyl cyclase CyaB
MPKNYELKTFVKSIENIREAARKLVKNKKHKHYKEFQKDIYYKTGKDRLKLRILNNETGNLIFYNRKERNKKRVSNYIISETKNFKELDEILKKLFDIFVVVDKEREIFIYDNIRIHLDKVKMLGSILEIEIIYDSFKGARKVMNELIEYFNLDEKDFIKESYSDMLIRKRNKI